MVYPPAFLVRWISRMMTLVPRRHHRHWHSVWSRPTVRRSRCRSPRSQVLACCAIRFTPRTSSFTVLPKDSVKYAEVGPCPAEEQYPLGGECAARSTKPIGGRGPLKEIFLPIGNLFLCSGRRCRCRNWHGRVCILPACGERGRSRTQAASSSKSDWRIAEGQVVELSEHPPIAHEGRKGFFWSRRKIASRYRVRVILCLIVTDFQASPITHTAQDHNRTRKARFASNALSQASPPA